MTSPMGKRVLIVEDEVLVALYMEDIIVDMGHLVIGPAITFDDAMEHARSSDFDFAVIDMNLAGTLSFPVADLLWHRGIPFIFATGYGNDGVAGEYRHAPVLRKPYAPQDLQNAVSLGLAG